MTNEVTPIVIGHRVRDFIVHDPTGNGLFEALRDLYDAADRPVVQHGIAFNPSAFQFVMDGLLPYEVRRGWADLRPNRVCSVDVAYDDLVARLRPETGIAINLGAQFGVSFDADLSDRIDSATASVIAARWADQIDAEALRIAYAGILPTRVQSGRERLGE